MAAFVLLMLGAFGAWRTQRAAVAGADGKVALLDAEQAFATRNVGVARQDLDRAKRDFARMHAELHDLGPLLPIGRVIPLVRVQVRGVEAMDDAGTLLAGAGVDLLAAENRIVHPADPKRPTSAALDDLRAIRTSLHAGLVSLDTATARVTSLDGYRLFGPIATAHKDLAARLPKIRARAASAQDGLDALIAFSGGSGPRRYLVFTQNPEEVRPTGGFIGTYGLLDAQSGRLSLETQASIESWYQSRPQAVVPADQAPSAFQFSSPPVNQTIANANSSPDWPQAAQLAVNLWQRGGGEPVDGVIGINPSFLARVLGVVGSVSVPEYNETIDASNLAARTNYYTHVEGGTADVRKRFISVLAQAVVQRLLDSSTSTWPALAGAVSQGFNARDAMAWSTDSQVQATLHRQRWDGALPSVAGDFLNDAEFEYTAKNGSGLKRTYDHAVTLHPDGSADLDTTLIIANTAPADAAANIDSLSYITLYGPQGARLVDGGDPPYAIEPDIAGHPAAGWLRSAVPGSQVTIETHWQAPGMAVRQQDGSWLYRIQWMHLAGHTGDVLHLQVQPPPGWHWSGGAPPETAALDRDFVGTWIVMKG